MHLTEIRNTLSVRGKNGIGFLLSGMIIWLLITVIFLQPFEIHTKNVLMLFSTALMFPLSVAITKFLRAEWKFDDIPLSMLGLYLNFAQFTYFPILLWAFMKSPKEMILFFAIITCAHLFPYGWLYNAKAYYVLSPILSIFVLLFSWGLDPVRIWLIPLTMVLFLLLLVGFLYMDYRKKAHFNTTYIYQQG